MHISQRQKSIIKLLADGAFHSGTELAATLGVSRSAVWKQINGLSDLGLGYASVSGKGYRLEKPLELLSQDQIYQGINSNTRELISSFEIHDQINSTNSYLMACARNNAPSGLICMAEHQIAGKGRRGRHWVSPFGNNIYLSILWRFQQSGPEVLSGLSLAIGIAVIRALKQHHIHNIELKWPNDIYSQGKKLGGILVEVSGESEGPCVAIIGLGLNLYLSETEAVTITQAWTDLTKVSGQNRLPRNQLVGTLLNQLIAVISGYEEVGIKAYLDEWRTYDCLKNRQATMRLANQQINGIVEGIDSNGLLLIKRPDGTVQAFASGEVTFNSE
ncbi:MAG: bifunctional biotin--[acetyl-CoA-carboxylase] ligase/biotin operon repressor BirA [Methylococcaceae bacterium]|nr:bifunctional biotin--[acetyl-CoA-carboxylase] ligase/biotin operon repressor BirA [Methylococcaceae bacterium]